jgi:hypothetical protein
MLLDLSANPRRAFQCIFGDGPAIALRQMMAGCIAFPGIVEQTLCAQHDIGRTPLSDELDGDLYVVDLSVNGGWSLYRGNQSLFVIDPVDGLVEWPDVR